MSRAQPPTTGKAAIVLGFIQGTWLLVDGVHRYVTGDFIRIHGQLGPWAQFASALGLDPMHLGWLVALLGAAWMAIANWYLFQNDRRSWRAMLTLMACSSWYLGPATLFLAAQTVLLLLPSTRRQLRPQLYGAQP